MKSRFFLPKCNLRPFNSKINIPIQNIRIIYYLSSSFYSFIIFFFCSSRKKRYIVKRKLKRERKKKTLSSPHHHVKVGVVARRTLSLSLSESDEHFPQFPRIRGTQLSKTRLPFRKFHPDSAEVCSLISPPPLFFSA